MAIATMPVALSLELNNYLLSWHHWRYFTRGMHMSEAPLSGFSFVHNIWEPYLDSMQGLALHVASFLHANNSWLDFVANSNITLLHPVCSSRYIILTGSSSSWTNSSCLLSSFLPPSLFFFWNIFLIHVRVHDTTTGGLGSQTCQSRLVITWQRIHYVLGSK